ncbi:uncharacterized protein [Mytilus edulis]|uniref:uncharacterized protein isoform X2 n=1 Tax=Mytilus edulis TaxID=6550 RepID=UPI0039EF914D
MCNRCQGICIQVYKHHLLRTKVLLEKMDLKVVLVFIGVLCVTHAKSWARSYDQDEEKLIRDLLRESLSERKKPRPPTTLPPPTRPPTDGPPPPTLPPPEIVYDPIPDSGPSMLDGPPPTPHYDEGHPPGPPMITMLVQKELPKKIDHPVIPTAGCACPPQLPGEKVRRCVCPPPPPPEIPEKEPERRRSRLQSRRLEAAIRNLEAVLNEEGK